MKLKNEMKIQTACDLLKQQKTLDNVNLKLIEQFGSGMSRTDLNALQRKVRNNELTIDNEKMLLKQFFIVFFKIGEIVQERSLTFDDFKEMLDKEMDDKLLKEYKEKLKI